MKPSSRHGVSKKKSARSFRKGAARTLGANLPITPMRGGWRL